MHRRTFLAASLALPLSAADPEAGFTSLFDGQTLKGWRVESGPDSAFYVEDGSIVVSESGNSPTWLRSERRFENFDFRCEFFVKGWIDSGIYLHAPSHGNPIDGGYCVKLFHKSEDHPKPESMGAIFPVAAPKLVNVKSKGEWNELRVAFDWPKLQVWSNGAMVQDLDVEQHPELALRLRDGYLGLQSLSYPIRFRNLRVKELAPKATWQTLYGASADFAANWQVEEGKAKWLPLGPVLRADNIGHLATKERYKDFSLEMYVRPSKHSNGGVIFRAEGSGTKQHYEIQIHDVEGAVYPTGSLYGFRRAKYPRITAEEWFLFQLIVKGKRCVVRVNGETVTDYDNLEYLEPGHIMLQAHQNAHWVEYKDIRVRKL